MPHCLQAEALIALAFEAPLQRRIELAHALPRIALQSRQDVRGYRLSLVEEALPDLVDRKFVHTCHSLSAPIQKQERGVLRLAIAWRLWSRHQQLPAAHAESTG